MTLGDYFTLFISKDWPTITSEDLPSGGPAYPLSTPGVRLRIDPTKESPFSWPCSMATRLDPASAIRNCATVMGSISVSAIRRS